MKTTNKIFSGMLVTVMVGASVASAATVPNAQSFLRGASSGIGQGMNMQNEGRRNCWQINKRRGMQFPGIENLSDEVKDQLKSAHEAHNPKLVREILEANGVEMPERPDRPKLSDEVRKQLRAAHEAKDMDKVKEILKANGIESPLKRSCMNGNRTGQQRSGNSFGRFLNLGNGPINEVK